MWVEKYDPRWAEHIGSQNSLPSRWEVQLGGPKQLHVRKKAEERTSYGIRSHNGCPLRTEGRLLTLLDAHTEGSSLSSRKWVQDQALFQFELKNIKSKTKRVRLLLTNLTISWNNINEYWWVQKYPVHNKVKFIMSGT